jgi:uncharacterized protein YkwD
LVGKQARRMSAEPEAAERVLYLAEMFPDLDIDIIESIVVSSEASASMQSLIDKCLALMTSEDSELAPDQAMEMISLIPPSISSPSASDSSDSSSLEQRLRSTLSKLRSGASAASASEAIGVLIHCLSNLIEHPDEPKFKRLRLDNEAFRKKLGRFPPGIECLKIVGFIEAEGNLVLRNYDAASLWIAKTLLEKELLDVEMSKSMDLMSSQGADSVDYLKHGKRKKKSKSPDQPKERSHASQVIKHEVKREQLADIHERRLLNAAANADVDDDVIMIEEPEEKKVAPPPLPPMPASGTDVRQQLKELRAKKHQKWRNSKLARQRVITVSELDKARREEAMTKIRMDGQSSGPKQSREGVHTIDNTFFDPDRIGRDALQYTNEFRKENGLPPCEWHQGIADIGKVHSKNMGDGTVPFGHDGFNERVAQFPVPHRSAAENVAMNNGTSEVARVAVNGWIDSP